MACAWLVTSGHIRVTLNLTFITCRLQLIKNIPTVTASTCHVRITGLAMGLAGLGLAGLAMGDNLQDL
jgi:hypothetical protein